MFYTFLKDLFIFWLSLYLYIYIHREKASWREGVSSALGFLAWWPGAAHQQARAHVPLSLLPHEKLATASWLLTSAWLRPGCRWHLGCKQSIEGSLSVPVLFSFSLSLSYCLSNKIKINSWWTPVTLGSSLHYLKLQYHSGHSASWLLAVFRPLTVVQHHPCLAVVL